MPGAVEMALRVARSLTDRAPLRGPSIGRQTRMGTKWGQAQAPRVLAGSSLERGFSCASIVRAAIAALARARPAADNATRRKPLRNAAAIERCIATRSLGLADDG